MFFRLKKKIVQLVRMTKKNSSESFWEARFWVFKNFHAKQNNLIISDFLKNCEQHRIIYDIFDNSSSLLEVGCGIGNSLILIENKYKNLNTLIGTDISTKAIKYSKKLLSSNNIDKIKYIVYDSLKEEGFKKLGCFDITFCSNVIEHFRNPYPLIDYMLEVSKYCLILVPYKHLSELNDSLIDGGEAHLFCFSEDSFKNYEVLESFTFKTKGWSNVTNHKDPKQLCVMLKGSIE